MSARPTPEPHGGVSPGAWITFDSVFAAECLVRSGFDWAVIDLQHGAIGPHQVVPLIAAVQGSGVRAWVRVQALEYARANWALDMGADVVVIPQVRSAEQARTALGHCLYPPHGHRSSGPVRAALRPAGAPAQRTYLMIEDGPGVAAADAIAATPGLDGVLIGTSDLTLSLRAAGVTGIENAIDEAVTAVVAACRRHGVDVAAYGGSPAMTATCARLGVRTIAVAADYELVMAGAAAAVRTSGGF